SSILISVPPYFEISTLSPFFTVKSTFFPLSSILPVPKATTFPSCGFSLAVSGMMIPPFFTSCSSSGCTSTRSPRGFTLTVAISCCYHSFGLLLCRQRRKFPEPSANWFRFFVGRLRETAWRLTQTPYNPFGPDSRFSSHDSPLIFSCSRPRLRTPHRRRRLRAYLHLLPCRLVVALQARAADLDADRPALHLFHFVLGKTGAAGDRDFLFSTGAEILGANVEDAVRVGIERHFDLRNAARSGWNSVEMENAELFVIARQWPLTLQHFDLHA